MVPDISAEHVDESELRRVASNVLFESDKNVFKRRFQPECTSDVFKLKHEVRHYLDTMHPYRDEQDKYRTFTKSRLGDSDKRAPDSRGKHGDFLNPRSSSGQRTTGYAPGHIRSVLQLDTYGPEHSREVENKRGAGLLPDSPNCDRNRELRLEVCAEMNKKTLRGFERAAPNTGRSDDSSKGLPSVMSLPRVPTDSRGGSRPLTGTRGDKASAGMLNVSLKARASTAGTKTRYHPGTAPTADNCPTYADRMMTDSAARSLEWYNGYVRGVQDKAREVQELAEHRRYQREQAREAADVSSNLDWFENRLNTLHNSKVESKIKI